MTKKEKIVFARVMERLQEFGAAMGAELHNQQIITRCAEIEPSIIALLLRASNAEHMIAMTKGAGKIF